ncbi:MAG: hypothetical protein RLY87_827 [Chloroflexota bacterium]|jgi:serine/threonine-protein kinase
MTSRPDILCPSCRRINPRRADACRFCGHALAFVDGAVKYSLTRLIKTGGQAVIFEAIDDSTHRSYAIKEIVLPLDPERTVEAFQRCAIEARLLATLAHPGIPRFYGSLIDNGRVYIVMDYVRGTDLEDILRQRGMLDEGTVLTIANQVCDILHYLHSQANPVIFRDVKPSNIMYDSDGTVTMIDFGIARFTNSQRGNIMGTPGYAPPEQYRGDISPSADIYALGATMHHLLSGRDPRGQKPFTYTAIRDLVPTVSPTTAAILSTALQLSPNDRFASILEMRESIRTVLRGEETIQFAILGATSPIPTVTAQPAPTITNAPPSAPLFLPTEADTHTPTTPYQPISPALPLVSHDTESIGSAYDTTVINDDPVPQIETHELDFSFAHHVESAIPDVDPSNERALTMEHKAIVVEPKTRWRVFVFVIAVVLCVAMLVLSNGGTNWQPWQANAQTITVVLEVDVPTDATLDASFQSALDAYLADTYGTQWTQIGTPTFLGTPPEQLAANPDGSSLYRGRLKVTLTRLP